MLILRIAWVKCEKLLDSGEVTFYSYGQAGQTSFSPLPDVKRPMKTAFSQIFFYFPLVDLPIRSDRIALS
jgi:hypothetical protein